MGVVFDLLNVFSYPVPAARAATAAGEVALLSGRKSFGPRIIGLQTSDSLLCFVFARSQLVFIVKVFTAI